MKYLFLSLCLLPAVIFAKNPVEHRQQLLVESQIIQIKNIILDYQPIIDHHDYENIMYHLYVIEVLLY
jgi:hypothetical protein